ncbi:S8 family peptidase [candidate division KSB1 bacterium]|nr:S8 family peptidase [candidate division KSB1 bacterium]
MKVSRFFIPMIVLLSLVQIPLGARNYTTKSVSASDKYLPGIFVLKISLASGDYVRMSSAQDYTAHIQKIERLLENYPVHEINKMFPETVFRAGEDSIGLSRIYKVKLPEDADIPRLCQTLLQDEAVEYAEPLYAKKITFTPNDPQFTSQWHLYKIEAEKAWGTEKGDSSVVIGIVDTGVDWHHPDLQKKIWINEDEIPDNGVDDDGNGYVDDVRGWDFVGEDNDPSNTSSDLRASHGTHTAGIAAAATNNAIGVASIGFNCKIMPVKASYDYEEDHEQNIYYGLTGIKYAVDNGADIISCSWGSSSYSSFEEDVLYYAFTNGAIVVAAAGNENSSAPYYPASLPHVFSVAATDQNDKLASFGFAGSNYGPTIDVSAPGKLILSTWHGGGYNYMDGTSMSTPLVAGLIGLVKSRHPDWTGEQAAEQVRISADDIYALNPSKYRQMGYGRINAFRALTVSSPSLRITEVSSSDTPGGDGDGIPEQGEQISIFVTLRNYLADASEVTAKLKTSDSYVQITSQNASYGAIRSRAARKNTSEPFQVIISSDTPAGHRIKFDIDITAGGGSYQDWDHFYLTVSPTYATHEVGNVALSITGFGCLGYYDYAEGGSELTVGVGFQYPRGSANALFHGSVIVAGSAEKVSDCCYGNSQHNHYDWITSEGGELMMTAGVSDLDGSARYNDSNSSNPIGVSVNQYSYSWSAAPDDDYVIVEYEVENSSAPPLSGIYVGLYMDWDIGDAYDNETDYDAVSTCGYFWNPTSKYYGICSLSPESPISYRAVSNEAFVWPTTSAPGFTDEEKYQIMTEGFQVTKSDRQHDWSQLMAAGPYNLDKGEKVTVAYAILGGEDKNDILENARAAKQKYGEITSVDRFEGKQQQVDRFWLTQNYPNPFNPGTEIMYQLASDSDVRLSIYNMLGQLTRTLIRGNCQRGAHRVYWDGRDDNGAEVPSGVYILSLRAGQHSQNRKIVLAR